MRRFSIWVGMVFFSSTLLAMPAPRQKFEDKRFDELFMELALGATRDRNLLDNLDFTLARERNGLKLTATREVATTSWSDKPTSLNVVFTLIDDDGGTNFTGTITMKTRSSDLVAKIHDNVSRALSGGQKNGETDEAYKARLALKDSLKNIKTYSQMNRLAPTFRKAASDLALFFGNETKAAFWNFHVIRSEGELSYQAIHKTSGAQTTFRDGVITATYSTRWETPDDATETLKKETTKLLSRLKALSQSEERSLLSALETYARHAKVWSTLENP